MESLKHHNKPCYQAQRSGHGSCMNCSDDGNKIAHIAPITKIGQLGLMKECIKCIRVTRSKEEVGNQEYK